MEATLSSDRNVTSSRGGGGGSEVSIANKSVTKGWHGGHNHGTLAGKRGFGWLLTFQRYMGSHRVHSSDPNNFPPSLILS